MLPLKPSPDADHEGARTLRIAIDATSVPPRPAGAAVYAIELVRAMAERDERDAFTLFTRGAAFDAIAADRPNWRIDRIGAASRPGRLVWEQVKLPRALASTDVLHSTHHTLPLAGVRCRRVVTIHDVTFFRIPGRYPPLRRLYFQTVTRLAARAADAIIVPSNAARDDVIRTLGARPSKVVTVYEAAGPAYRRMDREAAGAVARSYGIGGPYVLSVGSLEPGKNRARLIRAMHLLRDEGIEQRLVIVGQKAWRYEREVALPKELGMQDRVIFAGYVRAEDLPALYNAATALAMPSLYEGFGLPVIEAMACGVPVLTSDAGATAEVAGDAAVLVEPHSVDEIAGGLRRLLRESALRDDLAARGLQRAAQFSWRRAAGETLAVYARVARGEPAAVPR